MRLEGARTLVTGASGGLGAAIVRACTQRGALVVATGQRADALESLAAETGAQVVVADLADPNDLSRLAEEAGGVDVFVSNAALPAGGEVQTFSIADLDRALAVNVRAPVVVSRLVSEPMIQRRRGHIVFMSSLAAAFPTPGLSVYNATKAALSSYALSLRAELARSGVGVSVIHPGPIHSAGMWADTGLPAPAGIRMRSPEDVGAAVVRAIEENRASTNVAAVPLRAGAVVARAAPSLMAALAPKMGARRITDAIARSLADRR